MVKGRKALVSSRVEENRGTFEDVYKRQGEKDGEEQIAVLKL